MVATPDKVDAQEKLALLDSVPLEFWELLREHGPQLISLLKALLQGWGAKEPPDPPIGFGAEEPNSAPDRPTIYFQRIDQHGPRLWFHTGIRGEGWETTTAGARLL